MFSRSQTPRNCRVPQDLCLNLWEQLWKGRVVYLGPNKHTQSKLGLMFCWVQVAWLRFFFPLPQQCGLHQVTPVHHSSQKGSSWIWRDLWNSPEFHSPEIKKLQLLICQVARAEKRFCSTRVCLSLPPSSPDILLSAFFSSFCKKPISQPAHLPLSHETTRAEGMSAFDSAHMGVNSLIPWVFFFLQEWQCPIFTFFWYLQQFGAFEMGPGADGGSTEGLGGAVWVWRFDVWGFMKSPGAL